MSTNLRMRALKNFGLVGILIGLTIITVNMIQPRSAQARPDAPVVFLQEGDPVRDVQYAVGFADGSVNGSVVYDNTRVEGILNYVEFNQQTVSALLAAKQRQFYALVVFSRPLSRAEFENFASAYALRPTGYSLRARAPDGMRSTIFGGPVEGQLIPDELLKLATQDMEARDGTALTGWIDVSTVVDAKNLAQLVQDPLVYTVDVTETLLRNNITSAALSAAGADDTTLKAFHTGTLQVQMSRAPLFWFLEDLGLVSR